MDQVIASTAPRRRRLRAGIVAALCTALWAGLAPAPLVAQPSPGQVEADGTVVVPSFRLPPSAYLSKEAAAALPRRPTDPEAVMFQALAAGRAGEMRAKAPGYMAPRIAHLTRLFPVAVRQATIAGVPAMVVTPPAVPAANRRKVMLNLPGGGFVMATAGGTGMVESIPLAAKAQVEVVSITYRQAPEHAYPAATEDAVAVYRALLKDHRAEDIAVFGCSAGGLLTAQLVAALQQQRLPLPAAIGIFCASADARLLGDSRAYARPFQALPARTAPRNYFGERDVAEPLASPITSPALLRRFPPTLIVTATRAAELSSAVTTHRELVKAGVTADLHVWDGLGHAFFYDIDLPEAKDAFDVMAGFFRRHLRLAGGTNR